MKEKILTYLKEKTYRPLSEEDMAEALLIKGESLKDFFTALDELEKEGDIIKNRSGLFGLPERMNLAVGTLSMTSKGYGFVMPKEAVKDRSLDILIPARNLGGAMHGDTVIARIEANKSLGREGEIIRILKRANARIVGTFEKSKGFGFVTPDNQRLGHDIFISKADFGGAQVGMKVVVEITRWPNKNRSPEGKIIEVLGLSDDVGVDILSVMRGYDLKEEFPLEAKEEAKLMQDKVLPEELEGRLDRRDFPVITIDGDDSKDFDDAVYAKKTENGYFLGVYIADVSHYVRENSPLDNEARSRATSVYLVDRVIPMLPKELSNGICSLNEGVERLAVACEMEISHEGKVTGYVLSPAIIKSHRRLTYKIVNKILVEKNEQFLQDNEDILPMLKALEGLAQTLKEKRFKRGAIDFQIGEIKVKLDTKGQPVAIERRMGSLSESIIEECMLIANETVAEFMTKKKLPSIYRVHEEPTEEKINGLNELLFSFGHRLKTKGGIKPKHIQEILEKVKECPEETIVSKVALRSMQQAYYSPEGLGHFGLAAKYYTHFTSPIRRYPDLIVHRLLKEALRGRVSQKRKDYLTLHLGEWALHSSVQERIAAEAERRVTTMKAIEYMTQFIGEHFDGVISGVTQFGMFIELDLGVEGLVHVSRLVDDYYSFDEKSYSLIGSSSGKKYRLGDSIRVVLLKASVETCQLDFAVENIGNFDKELESFKKEILLKKAEKKERTIVKDKKEKKEKKGNRETKKEKKYSSKSSAKQKKKRFLQKGRRKKKEKRVK